MTATSAAVPESGARAGGAAAPAATVVGPGVDAAVVAVGVEFGCALAIAAPAAPDDAEAGEGAAELGSAAVAFGLGRGATVGAGEREAADAGAELRPSGWIDTQRPSHTIRTPA